MQIVDETLVDDAPDCRAARRVARDEPRLRPQRHEEPELLVRLAPGLEHFEVRDVRRADIAAASHENHVARRARRAAQRVTLERIEDDNALVGPGVAEPDVIAGLFEPQVRLKNPDALARLELAGIAIRIEP